MKHITTPEDLQAAKERRYVKQKKWRAMYYNEHPDRYEAILEYGRKYREEHREELNAKKRAKRKENKNNG